MRSIPHLGSSRSLSNKTIVCPLQRNSQTGPVRFHDAQIRQTVYKFLYVRSPARSKKNIVQLRHGRTCLPTGEANGMKSTFHGQSEARSCLTNRNITCSAILSRRAPSCSLCSVYSSSSPSSFGRAGGHIREIESPGGLAHYGLSPGTSTFSFDYMFGL